MNGYRIVGGIITYLSAILMFFFFGLVEVLLRHPAPQITYPIGVIIGTWMFTLLVPFIFLVGLFMGLKLLITGKTCD
jgi:hypothetical protein